MRICAVTQRLINKQKYIFNIEQSCFLAKPRSQRIVLVSRNLSHKPNQIGQTNKEIKLF